MKDIKKFKKKYFSILKKRINENTENLTKNQKKIYLKVLKYSFQKGIDKIALNGMITLINNKRTNVSNA